MKPVSGGSPPKESIVVITKAGVLGDRYEVTLRWPSVKILRCSASKNMVVFIMRYRNNIIRAILME